MATKTKSKSNTNNKKLLTVGVVVLVLVGLLGYRQWRHGQQKKNAAPPQVKGDQQSDSSKSSTSSGGVVDSDANSTNSIGTSQPQPTASSAVISLASPAEGAMVANGTTIGGTASVSKVQYRFKDADGLDVATGSLNVASGKYSGNVMGLNARTSAGTLEVYDYNNNGAEENWVKINVRYK